MNELIKNNKVSFIIGIIALIAILIFVTPVIVHHIVHSEIKTVKQETVQEIKKIDHEKAVKATANIIHKVSAFKKEVKQNLKQLDSADTSKH